MDKDMIKKSLKLLLSLACQVLHKINELNDKTLSSLGKSLGD